MAKDASWRGRTAIIVAAVIAMDSAYSAATLQNELNKAPKRLDKLKLSHDNGYWQRRLLANMVTW